ncbi:hypothetical protein [uncultured Roseobacter sp.]|uniref:hypothetical protein n=1 Tax=uncultured Roseobacter sp. TaxID=114847 RepID=UPI00260A12AD|nr:hypothetical protein [uncultured Roseobacter sp.]
MFASAVSFFWPPVSQAPVRPAPPKRYPSPVFIGDAVQPWGQGTMLLDILRREADADQSLE